MTTGAIETGEERIVGIDTTDGTVGVLHTETTSTILIAITIGIVHTVTASLVTTGTILTTVITTQDTIHTAHQEDSHHQLTILDTIQVARITTAMLERTTV